MDYRLVLDLVLLAVIIALAYRLHAVRTKLIGSATALTQHDKRCATVVAKRRGRGPVIYYAVLPVRATEREAVQDLVRWQAAVMARATNPDQPWMQIKVSKSK